uniref:FTP domain-containing protein n=1 Tax=Macrostomum lignano TaxID=282301 RepID=A0A1I8H7G8_9PLAT
MLLALLLLWAASPASQETVFEVIKAASATVPGTADSVPGYSTVDCSMKCARAAGCIGFSWGRSPCRLFSLGAFGAAWTVSDTSDIFIRTDLKRFLGIAGCNQSSLSTAQGSGGVCSFAIDGDRKHKMNSCSNTQSAPNQWVEVQLSRPIFVMLVTLYNNDNCCPESLNAFSLQVDGVECNRVVRQTPFMVANFTCRAYGSRVRVLSLLNMNLALCELELYGHQ